LLSKYQVAPKLLGEGAYGKVYAGFDKNTGRAVAIKHISDFLLNPYQLKQLVREAMLLRLLNNHPYIISLEYLAIPDDSTLLDDAYLVFGRYDSNLHNIIRSEQTLTKEHIEYILFQILHGIHYVHSAKVIHRDLKPANILINSNCTIKICDFGLARPTHDMRKPTEPIKDNYPAVFHNLTDYVVTRWYRSPEVILHCKGRGEPTLDIWSIGCIFAELLLRHPLFPGTSSDEVLKMIFDFIGKPDTNDLGWVENVSAMSQIENYTPKSREKSAEKIDLLSFSAHHLLTLFLALNPEKRITAERALQHYFFPQKYHIKKLLSFPLKPVSEEEIDSFSEYHQFEVDIDDATVAQPYDMVTSACQILKKESERYSSLSSRQGLSFFLTESPKKLKELVETQSNSLTT